MDNILPYNKKPIRDLYYEHAYHYINGSICKKGAKYNVPFKVNIVPENLVVVKGKYTYHHRAKAAAANWIANNQDHLFIEWWGPDSANVEAINNIIVRFRDYQTVSWMEEIAFYSQVSKAGSAAQQGFVGNKFGQIGKLTKPIEEYYPETRWQKFLASVGKALTPKKKKLYYEDFRGNWEIYQEEIMQENLDDIPRLG